LPRLFEHLPQARVEHRPIHSAARIDGHVRNGDIPKPIRRIVWRCLWRCVKIVQQPTVQLRRRHLVSKKPFDRINQDVECRVRRVPIQAETILSGISSNICDLAGRVTRPCFAQSKGDKKSLG